MLTKRTHAGVEKRGVGKKKKGTQKKGKKRGIREGPRFCGRTTLNSKRAESILLNNQDAQIREKEKRGDRRGANREGEKKGPARCGGLRGKKEGKRI